MTSDAPRSAARRIQQTPGFRTAARVGYAVNGLLNLLIGVLAISVAVAGASSGSADQQGALSSLASAPGGVLLIWVIAVGTAALGLWQIAGGVLATGEDAKERWATRLKEIGKGVAYLAISGIAIGTAIGGGSGGSGGSGGGSEESLTATLLATPGGVVLVVAVGLGALGVGGYMVAKGARRKFLEDITQPGGTAGRVALVTGIIGYVARGVAIGAIGVLFIAAGLTADPERAGGLDDGLAAVAELPFGQVLLVGIGVGFIAYGVYCGVRARYAKL
ncbi:DUF1206 domain-containing protein [Homoserinibacter sp. YIM 151385]|uniref:DUF1206 domain-containing protein n=1 Tax=Homoserinibacter sp. YIM 151385 TaxID=2985506 RepID=UPI0022F03B5A|nr:DUF1206 domain-containing protein [Homoserinibacter sp. YIM 151385]WBU39001.1 DUF1206 domain-containing protein [Homoserinibacter sp. YIM 151385]